MIVVVNASNETKVIKVSIWSYIIFFLLFSPLTVGPFFLDIDKYIDSKAWIVHLASWVFIICWLIYLYQEVIISRTSIEQRKIGLKGLKSTVMLFKDMKSWKPDHPYKLYDKDGNVLTIPWTTFRRADQKIIFEELNILGLPITNKTKGSGNLK